ncbi:hypothetical protein F0562_003643 [Nyssa sinensis]|uniref:Uncharacterized protein n=1 Tax=Nyssa sinensis TaxID=561372 RepID=A0A5J5C198_9ASTE|nr:hypothetical protein F0562_003643 [Nyssa sinensis]
MFGESVRIKKEAIRVINDDGDLTAFITKYQDAFPEDVIVNLAGEESSSVPYNREGFIKFHPLEIDSLHCQILSLDDVQESIKDELLKKYIDLQESWEELSLTRSLLRRSREEAFFERDNSTRLGRERDALKVALGEKDLKYVASCYALVSRIQGKYQEQVFKFQEEAYQMGYENAQVRRPLTFPPIEVKMVVVREEVEE